MKMECDDQACAIVEPSNEKEEQNLELMELVVDTSMVENHGNMNGVHIEADSNLSNQQMECRETVTNETNFNVNLSNENIDMGDPSAEELSARGISRMQFTIEKITESCCNGNVVTSPPFMCRKLPFHLLVMIVMYEDGEKLEIYLERGTQDGYDMPNENRYPDESTLQIVASATITVVDQSGLTKEKTFENHLFRDEANWGFRILTNEIDINNSITISANVTAHPPFCHNFDSKAITGHVGIKNQGATCYMNSLLEVLFFLTKFRTACYRIPTEMDNYSSMALALQKFFYNLQFSDMPVSTIDLTKSFGWSLADTLVEHDLHEFMRLLFDKIESRMKNTLLENIIPSMFEGTSISYVKCRDIDFNSQREEIFYDIQLSLENANNVYEAFNQWTTPEIMDNGNKYDAGNFGLQAAEKRTLFSKLPPVMFLHLQRFQFDGTLNQTIKNNNFFEFYDHIDLTEYVCPVESKLSTYTLFAVVAHSMSGHYGHYVSYINSKLDGNWLKFDDDKISLVHPYDAINNNFGINQDGESTNTQQQGNAYILVYIRDSDAKETLEPVDSKYIDELKIYLTTEQRCMDDNSSRTSDVYLFLNTHLESGLQFEAVETMKPEMQLRLPKFSIQSDISTSQFKSILMTAFKISTENQLRIWPIYHSTNISHPVYINTNDPFVSKLSEFKHEFGCLDTVWIEIALPGCELPSFDPAKDVLIFYYFYCSVQCHTYFIDHGYHGLTSSVAELVPKLNNLMEWKGRELNIYEDCGESKIRKLDMSDYLINGITQRCRTFIMKIVFEPKENDTSMSEVPNIYLYYRELRNRLILTLSNVDDPAEDKMHGILTSINATFPELIDLLATNLNHRRERIQIFQSYAGNYKRDAIPSASTEKLSTLLNCSSQQEKHIFFKLHSVNVVDVETKNHFHFRWLSIDMKKIQNYTLYISNDETFENILAEAQKLLQPDLKNGSGIYRLVRVRNNKLNILHETSQIYQYLKHNNDRNYFRIDEIPKGDELISLNERNVMVFHFSSHNRFKRFLGHPFIIKINLDEQWKRIKQQIWLRLRLSDTTRKRYRPVIYGSEDQDFHELAIQDTECISDINPIAFAKYIIRLDHIVN